MIYRIRFTPLLKPGSPDDVRSRDATVTLIALVSRPVQIRPNSVAFAGWSLQPYVVRSSVMIVPSLGDARFDAIDVMKGASTFQAGVSLST